MKSRIYFVFLAVVAACFYSCESASGLASKIQGVWSGGILKVNDHSAFTTTYTPVFTFVKQPNQRGGTFTLDAMVTTSGIVETKGQALVVPISLSVSANTSVMGQWQATDNDEVSLIVDGKTLQIEVDPEAVALNYNELSGESSAVVDSIRPQLLVLVKSHMESAMTGEFAAMHKLDDIKFNKTLMECELNDADITFRRN